MNEKSGKIDAIAIVVGCGGIGFPLASRLTFLYSRVHVYDGDVFDAKNEDRQSHPQWRGRTKVNQLIRANPSVHVMLANLDTIRIRDIMALHKARKIHVFLAVDNAEARVLVHDWCTNESGYPVRPEMVITGANEFDTGEAYVWIPSLSPQLLPDPAEAFPMAWHVGEAAEKSPHCHELEASAGGEQLAAVNATVAGDMIFLAQAWGKNIPENPDFVTDGVPLPWCVRTSLIRKDVDYVRFAASSLEKSSEADENPS